MKSKLVITLEAQEDFEDILVYTQEKWGNEQCNRYAGLLNSALQMLEENPLLGKRHKSLPPVYRTYHIGRHYLIYRIKDADVIVLRVLHDRMNLPNHIL